VWHGKRARSRSRAIVDTLPLSTAVELFGVLVGFAIGLGIFRVWLRSD